MQVEMTWSLPAPDDRVEWSLWTSSNDSSSLNLKLDFYEAMKALGKHQYFTPYYQVPPTTHHGRLLLLVVAWLVTAGWSSSSCCVCGQ